ncbi:MAG: membrane associated rhomboid family serine protease [Glaciecola sp.]|jgi:membrane associated rhomboid family serine protease
MNFLNNIPPVTKNLLIINVLMFLLQNFIPAINEQLALYFFMSPDFQSYQVLTHMFMHSTGGLSHIFFNMFGVYMFGSALEQRLGSVKFFKFYLMTGFGAVILHSLSVYVEQYEIIQYLEVLKESMVIEREVVLKYLSGDDADRVLSLYKEQETVNSIRIRPEDYPQIYSILTGRVVGASGALFGLLAGFAMLYPNQRLYLMFIPVPIKAKYFVIGYAAVELFSGVTGTMNGIAHFAHLGGALFGFIIIKFWKSKGSI